MNISILLPSTCQGRQFLTRVDSNYLSPAVSPIPDVTKLFTPTGMEVKSPATEVFTSMRTYGRPGEERVAHQSIRQVLWQLYIAAHDICAGLVR